MSATQHVVTALVQNEAGTINRLVSLFRRRGFSLASFNAGDCEEAGFSRLTLLVNGDDEQVSQCIKQLDKLIDVVECQDHKPDEVVSKELAMIRVEVEPDKQADVEKIASEFMAVVVARSGRAVIVEIGSDPAQIERLILALKVFSVKEVVRTGLVAMSLED
jgi:acetolactate synthase-1/3 small subunit